MKSSFHFEGEENARVRTQPYETPIPGGAYHGSPISPYSPEYSAALVPTDAGHAEFVTHEMEHKKLFFDTLNTMLKEEQVDLDAKQMYQETAQRFAKGIFASEHVLVMRDFSSEDHLPASRQETTTPYKFYFRFLKIEAHGKQQLLPLLEMDARPWALLRKYGVSEAQQREYCLGFLEQREKSGHDYLHELMGPLIPEVDVAFAPMRGRPVEWPEMHALALHARIWARIFAEEPWRKTQALEEIASLAHGIGDIQQTALAHAKTPQEIKAIETAVTYLAEPFGHSLFRVFAPSDAALQEEKVMIRTKDGIRETTVREELDALHIQVPQRLVEKNSDAMPAGGFAKLRVNCSDWIGNDYEALHHIKKLPLYFLDKPKSNYDEAEILTRPSHQVSLVQILGIFAEAGSKLGHER